MWGERCLLLHRTPDVFAAYKLKKGQWVPTRLRVTAFAVERLDADGDALSLFPQPPVGTLKP
jgi:hypothetical protein